MRSLAKRLTPSKLALPELDAKFHGEDLKVTETTIPGVVIVEPKIFSDNRGFFTEMYQASRYAAHGIAQFFVQDNLSRSVKGTLRGLHFQNPRPQGKLVTVLRGAVLDIAVDVRVGSPTFGQYIAVRLNEENRRQVWIPGGLAHGFIVTSDFADLFYKCDEFYSPADEFVLRWDDPALNIRWGCDAPLVSARDSEGRYLKELAGKLPRFEPLECVF